MPLPDVSDQITQAATWVSGWWEVGVIARKDAESDLPEHSILET
jgi:hypothetical protein